MGGERAPVRARTHLALGDLLEVRTLLELGVQAGQVLVEARHLVFGRFQVDLRGLERRDLLLERDVLLLELVVVGQQPGLAELELLELEPQVLPLPLDHFGSFAGLEQLERAPLLLGLHALQLEAHQLELALELVQGRGEVGLLVGALLEEPFLLLDARVGRRLVDGLRLGERLKHVSVTWPHVHSGTHVAQLVQVAARALQHALELVILALQLLLLVLRANTALDTW